MKIEFVIPFIMLFCHIIDDYYLQGILANLKQKKWWKENEPNEKYRYDYLMALFMHSFSWSFMINLPILVYGIINNNIWSSYIISLIVNTVVHFIVDNSKANKYKINLIEDQIIHILQIIAIFTLWYTDLICFK